MNFSKELNKYMDTIGCTSKEISDTSKLSMSVISRYKNGKRVPSVNSKQFNTLIDTLLTLSKQKNLSNITKESLINDFSKTLDKDNIDFEQVIKNFNELVSTLNISMIELAKALNFDASYLSRIRNFQRKPSDVSSFVNTICHFIVQRYKEKEAKLKVVNLINCHYEDIKNSDEYLIKLSNWLCSNITIKHNYMDDFLKKLDEFDLNEYINSIHFNEMKVPTMPFKIPTSKTYYGIEEMKNGELDFFKTTILSKNMDNIFMCSDMPMEDMAKDIEFGKKWMFAIALSLKKGLHLNVIHNLDRPFKEMMLGLESWIPIYMTGQVSPYYLKNHQNNIYYHLNYVSGSAALTGECIKDSHHLGKYYLTNNKKELTYYKNKAESILSKASPLIEIYRKESKDLYTSFLKNDVLIIGERRNILSIPPIYTISDELLLKILERNQIIDKKEVLNIVNSKKERIDIILKHSLITDEIVKLSKEEFMKNPINLSLDDSFYDNKITYTYEEYLEHFKLMEKYMKNNSNYKFKINNENIFRNIQIFIHNKKWVIISKSNTPTIHFLIHHSKLREAIENFAAPIIE